MPARRILVVSPDRDVQQMLAKELSAVGGVELHAARDTVVMEPPAALCVLHDTAPEPFACPVIAVMAHAGLPAMVEILGRSDHVVAVIGTGALAQLPALVARVLANDGPGLESEGAEVYSATVGTAADKARCLAKLAEVVAKRSATGVERLEQCVDELVMNALYVAPVDAHGDHIFAGIPVKTRITMRTQQNVSVRFACSATQLAISVRDAFGSLRRETVIRHLAEALHSAEAVDRKAGGAGLGLYLIATSAAAVFFHVVPGVATDVTCVFDLGRAQHAVSQLAFVVHAAAGRAATPPARRVALPNPRRRWAIGSLAAAVLWGIALQSGSAAATAGVEVTTMPGASIAIEGRPSGTARDGALWVGGLAAGSAYHVVARLDGYEPKRTIVSLQRGANAVELELQALATVELSSVPSDANVAIDGHPMGTTPLELTSLPPGTSVSVVLDHPGYKPATLRVQVPARGQRQRVVQPLEVSTDVVRVHVVSTPPGAAIVREGERPSADRTYTPADLFVDAGKEQRITLLMPKHKPFVVPPFTPARGQAVVEQAGKLEPVASP